jgi:hypothetical protein
MSPRLKRTLHATATWGITPLAFLAVLAAVLMFAISAADYLDRVGQQPLCTPSSDYTPGTICNPYVRDTQTRRIIVAAPLAGSDGQR